MDDIPIHEIDITDLSALYSCFGRGYDIVHHLAAQANIPIARENPSSCLNVNILGTQNVLTAAIHFGVKGFHFASSSDVYGPATGEITLSTPRNPIGPYGISKLAGEMLVKTCPGHLKSFSTRLFTCLGPGQYRDSAFGSFSYQVSRILKKETNTFHCGNLTNTRSLIDVRDVVKCYVKLMERCIEMELLPTDAVNIAGQTYSMIECVQGMFETFGVQPIVKKGTPRPNDITLQYSSPEPVLSLIGSLTPISRTLEDMVNWWLNK